MWSVILVKTNPFVSSQARKVRKAFFNATKDEKHVQLSAKLSKELQEQYGIKRLPVRIGDEVKLSSGSQTKREGKVTQVKLTQMRIFVDSYTKEKLNGQSVQVPLHPSNVVLTKLKMDSARKKLIEQRRVARVKILANLGHK